MNNIRYNHKSILKAMYKDRVVDAAEAKRIDANISSSADNKNHPLVDIAASLPAHQKDKHLINLEELAQWFAEKCDLEYIHIDPLHIDIGAVTKVVAPEYARQHGILVVRVDSDSVTFAAKNPIETYWIEGLEPLLRKQIRLVFANPKDIDRYINEFYSLAKSIHASSLEEDRESGSLQQNLEQMVDLAKSGQLDAEDHHIVQVVDWLLQYAFEQRASDIHLEPRRDRGEIRFRIDGVLHYAYQVPPNVMLAIIGRLKTLARMDIAEKRRPLDGRLKTRTPDDKEIELRLSTVPTAMGEKMVMRIFDPSVLQRSFEELGLGSRELQIWNDLTKHTNGIILVTGPTGSGKTTTLYSTLRKLASSENNVCTIEDPIEMVEPSFNQIQAHHSIGLDFASGIRALLRQDPDIIMIGEIRDLATAEMAIQAALTGHLVLSTLHTNDACSAITRLLELGVPSYLINATVLGVMAQRLVRTLCVNCKKPVKIEEELWQNFCSDEKIKPDHSAHGEGCLECRQTGYMGRIGLYEMLQMSDSLRKLVLPEVDLQNLRQQAYKEGLTSLRLNGAVKVAGGITTINEVLRVTPFN